MGDLPNFYVMVLNHVIQGHNFGAQKYCVATPGLQNVAKIDRDDERLSNRGRCDSLCNFLPRWNNNDATVWIKRLPSLTIPKKTFVNLICETRWKVAVNMADSISLLWRELVPLSMVTVFFDDTHTHTHTAQFFGCSYLFFFLNIVFPFHYNTLTVDHQVSSDSVYLFI